MATSALQLFRINGQTGKCSKFFEKVLVIEQKWTDKNQKWTTTKVNGRAIGKSVTLKERFLPQMQKFNVRKLSLVFSFYFSIGMIPGKGEQYDNKDQNQKNHFFEQIPGLFKKNII